MYGFLNEDLKVTILAAVLLVILALPMIIALGWMFRIAVRLYAKYRGKRLIVCPETHECAAVNVDAIHTAVSGAFDTPDLRLSSCTRWPERAGCGQECLQQIEESPEGCLVKNILTRWFDGKVCAFCQQPIGEIHWIDYKPAILAPDGKSIEWGDLRPERIPALLEHARPVCFNCHIAETFRREHPELVTDRDFTGAGRLP